MKTQDTKAIFKAFNIGGRKNATVTITLEFEIYLSEWGDEGFADVIFDAAPAVRAAMQHSAHTDEAGMSLPAEKIFDGLKPHRLTIWGLPAESRQSGARPLLDTSAATLRGMTKFALAFGDGGNTACKVKVPFKISAGELRGFDAATVGEQLHSECYVDVELIQVEDSEVEDGVAPTVRRSQDELPWGGDDTYNADADAVDPDDDEQAEASSVGYECTVLLLNLPDAPLDVFNYLESEGMTTEDTRDLVEKVAKGTVAIFGQQTEDRAFEIAGRLRDLGATVRVRGPKDADGEWRSFVGDLDKRTQILLGYLERKGEVTEAQVVEDLDLGSAKAIDEMLGPVFRWAPVRGVELPFTETRLGDARGWRWFNRLSDGRTGEDGLTQPEGTGDGPEGDTVDLRQNAAELVEKLRAMPKDEAEGVLAAANIEVLKELHVVLLGKPTTSKRPEFIAGKVLKALT